ncbi:MAG: helix-turn-helix domain-containing protein [Clostridia bacterium]|nr:helix-turn-helix domain-containing protein [Clostridia bacterium]
MLDYCLDINDQSFMRVYTPDATAISFPFCLYEDGYFEAGKNYYTKRSEKEMYLLLYTVSGCGTVKVDGKIRYLPAGSAAILDCREPHEYSTVSGAPWCFHWIHFDGPSMDAYKKILLDEFDALQITEKLRINRYFEQIHAIMNENNAMLRYALTSDIISGILLILCNSRFSKEVRGEVDSDAVRTACRFIEENLRCDISIDQLSAMVHLSKFYFIRLFKRYMGVSPYQYVQITRVNRAKELLMTTGFRVNEISEMVGFSSPTRFTKFFSDMTGMSPTLFRKTSYKIPKED